MFARPPVGVFCPLLERALLDVYPLPDTTAAVSIPPLTQPPTHLSSLWYVPPPPFVPNDLFLLFILQGLWSTIVLVLRAKSDAYEVQVHSGGPVLVVPENFSERNLVRFLSEVLLSFS